MDNEKIQTKIKKAKSVILASIGKNGIYADPTRYLYQCWTRDFVIAAINALFDLEQQRVIKNHLTNLIKRQRVDGRIPILFLDNTTKWLIRKIKTSIIKGQPSFMLRNFFHLEMMTPWTKDSEILFIIGMTEYFRRTGDEEFFEKNEKARLRN